jgi:hypothetical protein
LNQLIEKYQYYIFLLLLFFIFILFNYQFVIFQGPYGIHFIRQTDSLSFVSNYYHNGFHFFEPEIFNLSSINGKNACEFPIVYYFTALLYLIFGENDFILRLITYSISSIAFIYLFKICKLFIQNIIISILFTLILISSPILQYYSINFLPDGIVLAFTIIAWYHFLNFILNNKKIEVFYYSFIFFGIASLIKVTYFIHPFAAILTLLLMDLFKLKSILKTLKTNAKQILIFILILIIILSWTYFLTVYNAKNNANYFTIKPLPIWELHKTQIFEVLDHLTNHWFSQFYYPSTIHLYYVLIFIFILNIYKLEKKLIFIVLFLFLGLTFYFILFFKQFKNHDYYLLNFLPMLFIVLIISINRIEQQVVKYQKKYLFPFIQLILFVFVILSYKHTKIKMNERFDIKRSDLFADIGKKLRNTRTVLAKNKIPKSAKFIICNDKSPNGGLYFINRKGWNVSDTSVQSLNLLNHFLSKNEAKYIIYTDKKLVNKKLVSKFICVENGNYIYRLK